MTTNTAIAAGPPASVCPTCRAKFQYGSVEAPDILDQVTAWRAGREGGSGTSLSLELCGVPVQIHFTEKHLLDLQEILKSAERATQPLDPNVTLKEASWSSVLLRVNPRRSRVRPWHRPTAAARLRGRRIR